MMDKRSWPARRIDQPQPGFYLLKLVKGGPLIAGKICQEDGFWWAEINGRIYGLPNEDPLLADGVERCWLGTPCNETQYLATLALKDIPGHPNSTPLKPINLTSLPPIKP